jgi:hypothetical protein
LQFADQATLSFDAMSHPEAKIWVALSPASMKKLREFRDFLGKHGNGPLTLSQAIYAIIESVYLANLQKPLD